MRFAHVKRILKLDRLRSRDLSGAKDEVLLTAIAQKSSAAGEVHLPATALGAGCLSAVAGTLDVGADASLPQLPHGESGTAMSKIYDR